MKTDTIKISFVASILFHSIVIYIFTSHLSSVKNTAMNITPIEIINIDTKNTAEQVDDKMEDTPPPLPEKEIKKIKEELPPKIEEKIIEEPKITKAVEAPHLPAPTEQEIIKEAAVESPPPLIEEAFEKPAEEPPVVSKQNLMLAESAESTPDEIALKSEVSPHIPPLIKGARHGEFDTVAKSIAALSGKHAKTIGSNFSGVSGGGSEASREHTKTIGSKYGVEGGTGSVNGEEMSLFRAMVRTKIERSKFYPRWARERGFEGVVGVRFVVHPDGGVTDVKVVRPCHCEVLNKAACEAIMKAAPFNPRPIEVADKEMAMEIDISYRLD